MGRNQRRKKSGNSKWIVILGLLVVVGGIAAFIVYNNYQQEQNKALLAEIAATIDKETYYNGIFVDDIPLGGLTKTEAKQQVMEKQKVRENAIGVTLAMDTQTWKYTSSDITHTLNTDAILDQAWKIGREGNRKDRYNIVQGLAASPQKLSTTLTIDSATMESKVRELALTLNTAPVDAAYTGYDLNKPENDRLVFTPDVQGRQVDADTLWTAVKAELDNQTFGTVQIQYTLSEPAIKLADIQPKMQLVVRYRSQMKDHSVPRRTNIGVANNSISGRILQPGDIFSFNDTVGERTEARGFMEAHVLNAGVTDNGIGGGICQVSGTLFNAIVRADLEIVDRTAHSVPSAYLPLSQDATVDWGRLDLKFKNNRDTPVMLIMYWAIVNEKYYEYAEVYGEPLETGVTIELYTKVTEELPPLTTVSFAQNKSVKPGTTEIAKPHGGYRASTYKVYKKDGVQTKRIKLHDDYYKPTGSVILYNPADPRPTLTPTPTPTPTIEPTPTVVPTT